MSNPFLVIRFIVLSLSVYLNLLSLVFASWHIAVADSSGFPVPGAAVFLITNSCALFLFVALSFADFACPKANNMQIKLECGWTGLLSIPQLAAAIDATVEGPPIMCQTGAPWGLCASSYLLVPVSWMSSITLFTYFIALLITAAMHVRMHPGIWSSTVYSIPWFAQSSAGMETPRLPSNLAPHANSVNSKEDSCSILKAVMERFSRAGDDEESRASSPAEPVLFSRESRTEHSLRPQWARSIQTKRGVDEPFARRDGSETKSYRGTLNKPPSAHVRYDKQSDDFDAVEVPVDSTARTEPTALPQIQRGSEFLVKAPFARAQADPNLPIPLPRLSEWIRADAAEGINVHTILPISP